MGGNREYIYSGSPIPKVTQKHHADFILNYQGAILRALMHRGLITQAQCEQCIEELRSKGR